MADLTTHRPKSRGITQWWSQWKNGFYSKLWVQDLFSRLPIFARLSRKEGEAIFQMMTGFVDTQILLYFVRSGLLADLKEGPLAINVLAQNAGLDTETLRLLCRAGVALKLVHVHKDRVSLARRGALVLGLPGIAELIDHHSILYQDMADPTPFFKGDMAYQLAAFWPYVFGTMGTVNDRDVARYSDLMTKSQFMVARDTLRAISPKKNARWLDVGGGSGAFVTQVTTKHPHVTAAVFDLNGAHNGALGHDFIEGSFFTDPLPEGFDVISLIRVLYDHSDDTVRKLLTKVYTALPSGGHLVVSEPMLGDPHPNRFGDTYFAVYTFAMQTGKTRSAKQISDILKEIGFSSVKIHPTKRPFVTTVIEAIKN